MGWILTKDKLPPYNKEVLAGIIKSNGMIDHRLSLRWFNEKGNDRWIETPFNSPIPPDYWMAIPTIEESKIEDLKIETFNKIYETFFNDADVGVVLHNISMYMTEYNQKLANIEGVDLSD